ncbi:hypothetical protein ACVWZ3_001171 [Bradyrhizobium sp. i1.3.6]
MLRGRGQRRRGSLELGRGRAHGLDHLADRGFKLIGKPEHVLATLRRAALLHLLLLGFHPNLGKAVLPEHFRGLGDFADLVLAIKAGDLDLIAAGGKLLEHTDDHADRPRDAVLTDDEAQRAADDDTEACEDDQEA